MKLYIQARSERAEKGQGGNKFLESYFYVGDQKNPKQVAYVRMDVIGDEVQLMIVADGVFEKQKFPLIGNKEYCFQCSPDGKYTIKGVCHVCKAINKRSDKFIDIGKGPALIDRIKGNKQKTEKCARCDSTEKGLTEHEDGTLLCDDCWY